MRTEPIARPARICGIAATYHYSYRADAQRTSDVSGYDWTTFADGLAAGRIAPDAIVLDKRTAEDGGAVALDDLVRFAVRGPMLDEELPPGTRLGLGHREPVTCSHFWAARSLDRIAADLYLTAAEEIGATVQRIGDYLEAAEADHLARWGRLPILGAGRYARPLGDWRAALADTTTTTKEPTR